jgi:hypothetical protein
MSDLYWIGEATAVAQITTIAISTYDAATTYKLTIGGVTVSAIAAGSTTATAAALATAWNASASPYLAAATAAAATGTVTLTADTAGVPFVVTSSVSGGAGTIGAPAAVTASAGPNDWSTAANWSTGSIPANGDNVYFRNNAVPVLFGLSQTAVAPALLIIEQTYSGTIGLPYNAFTTAAGTINSTVPEYRQSYLAIAAAVLRIGENYSSSTASGSSLLKVDLSTAASSIECFNCGTSADGLPPVRLKTNSSAALLKVYGSSQVGLCFEQPAESGTIGEIDVYPGGNGGQPSVFVGANVTQTTHRQLTGTAVLRNAPATLTIEYGSTVTLAGAGTIGVLQPRGGLTVAGTYAVTSLQG